MSASKGVPDDTYEDDRDQTFRPALVQREHLYVVLEADRPLASGARYALDGIDEIRIGRGLTRSVERDSVAGKRRLLLSLPGRRLSSLHACIRRSGASWIATDAGSTNGSYVNGARVSEARLCPDDVLEVGRSFLMIGEASESAESLRLDLDDANFTAESAALRSLYPELQASFESMRRIAQTNLTVLVCGETGTGKELMAAAIHELSGRAGPLVPVNCGALSETLVEAQLFGHLRGSFSGAIADNAGFVRAAERGTLLLDEVQDLKATGQAALLRVLQQREITPVGGARPQSVHVRFVATAPAPLDAFVERGQMRADLQARLQGCTHITSPLRERRRDLGVLIASVLQRTGVRDADQPTLSIDFALRLFRHSFPQNVRELEHLLQRGWALSKRGCIEIEFAVKELFSGGEVRLRSNPIELSARDASLRAQLHDELGRSHGNVAAVARALGKAPMQVRRWLKRFDLDPDRFRG